jgi:hypothetical protein
LLVHSSTQLSKDVISLPCVCRLVLLPTRPTNTQDLSISDWKRWRANNNEQLQPHVSCTNGGKSGGSATGHMSQLSTCLTACLNNPRRATFTTLPIMQELQALDQAVKAADRARFQQPPRRKPQLQLKLRASPVPAANGELGGELHKVCNAVVLISSSLDLTTRDDADGVSLSTVLSK